MKWLTTVYLTVNALIYSALLVNPLHATEVGSDSSVAYNGAVAMPDIFSAQVATDVLRKGGNAVDAAVAAQFVLAVTFPEAGNIGGGGFMVIADKDKQLFLDYREKAPARATRDMYLDEQGNVIDGLSLYGILASGVPGSVAGMWEAHQKYGSLQWKELVQPAVDLAEFGFVVPAKLSNMVHKHIKKLHDRGIVVNFAEHFGHIKTGMRFTQHQLAQTLRRIRDYGRDGFYTGKTAKIIADFMNANKGIISEADLAAYKPVWRQPLVKTWRGMDVIAAAPPSSGGIAMLQWLQMYDMVKQRDGIDGLALNSASYIHLISEIGKRVFADRAEYLGDPDFIDVPSTRLLAQEYLVKRTDGVSTARISHTPDVQPGLKESEDTTHFSIIDVNGLAVSNTTTINLGFGSSVVVEGAGFLLNDEMDDFSAKPGVANYFGALGKKANAIAPGKRMLSSMTPTIVRDEDGIRFIVGSPGGTTIISSVVQAILNDFEHHLPAQDVVDSPRFHHQLYPKDRIRMHPGFSAEVIETLEGMGYEFDHRRFGDLHVIMRRGQTWHAASESSGRGSARVIN